MIRARAPARWDTTRREHIPWGKPWDRQPVSGKLRRKLGVSPGFAATSRQELEPVQVADAAGSGAMFDHDVEAPHPGGRGDGCGHRGPRFPAARNRNGCLRDDGSGRTIQMELQGAPRACTGYAHVDGTNARAEIDIAVFGPGAVLREA